MQNVCSIRPMLKQITECDFEKVWKWFAFTLMGFKYNQMMQVKQTSFQKGLSNLRIKIIKIALKNVLGIFFIFS